MRWGSQGRKQRRMPVFYREQENSMRELRGTIHDFKNQLMNLKQLYDSGDNKAVQCYAGMMEELKARMDPTLINVNNSVISNILYRCKNTCDKKGIRFSLRVEYDDLSFISPMDASSIFDNAIDNAIRACLEVEEDKRFINIRINRQSWFILFKFENSIRFGANSDISRSTKPHAENHGYGIKNMRRVVEDYGGDLTYDFGSSCTLLIRIQVP